MEKKRELQLSDVIIMFLLFIVSCLFFYLLNFSWEGFFTFNIGAFLFFTVLGFYIYKKTGNEYIKKVTLYFVLVCASSLVLTGIKVGFFSHIAGTAKNDAKKIYSKITETRCEQYKKIVTVGGCDSDGSCGVIFEDGSKGEVIKPVVGEVVCADK